ncbi:LysR family transcriptional regulator [Brevibacillus choshinensis]|uniref:LysR family transcriptional regulator n=1 Tax=Brevibacillus choshinensis TaxID=54911 RepID=UPI002E1BF0F8|nr:LysR family transcriptional regulator [Brevibacillus choshinensis]
MNKSLLQLMVKIADTKSFTQAGKELNMSQPAVSKAVNGLETELGVTLLIRNRRHGVMLTPVGERIVRIFRAILSDYEKVDQEIAHELGLEKGLVKIGAFPDASSYFVPKIISHITKKYPNIEFTILEGTVTEVKGWIDTQRIDIGFIIACPPDKEFNTFPLHQEEMYAVLNKEHPLTTKNMIQATDLLDQPLIFCKSGYETPVIDWFEKSRGKPKVRYEIRNYMTGINLVHEGLGIAIMPELTLVHLPENVLIRKLDPPVYRNIHMAVLSFEDSGISVKLFIETALQLFPQFFARFK